MKLIYLLALVVMTTVANVVSENIPKCSIWHPMGRIPDETDCTRYYQCIFAIPRLTICPIIADKQTYFDPTLELCLWSETSPCENPSTSAEPGTDTTEQTTTEQTTTEQTTTERTTTTEIASMKCPKQDIPEPPARPDDCPDTTSKCKGPIKDDCTSYYEWTGKTDKEKGKCFSGLYFNRIIHECDYDACPLCPTPPVPF